MLEKTCFTKEEAEKSNLVELVKAHIKVKPFEPHQHKQTVDHDFCNESVYEKCNLLVVSGLVNLERLNKLVGSKREKDDDEEDNKKVGGRSHVRKTTQVFENVHLLIQLSLFLSLSLSLSFSFYLSFSSLYLSLSSYPQHLFLLARTAGNTL